MEIKKGEFMMLPPAAGVCQICATEHEEVLPHNRDSLYYQFWFHAQYGRSPAWADAMLHCSEETRQMWFEALRKAGLPESVIGDTGGDRHDPPA